MGERICPSHPSPFPVSFHPSPFPFPPSRSHISAVPPTLRDVPTPALLLDLDILERNISTMAAKTRRLGARLRPHIKTHKCIEVGRRQCDAGAEGMTVATIVEARDFAQAGFTDITWAFPLIPSRLAEVVDLARRITLRVLVDSEAAAAALDAAARAAGLTIHTWLEVDCGYHRSGVDPARRESVALAAWIAQAPGLTFDGILTHAGHSYHAKDAAERAAVAREERSVMTGFAAKLRDLGIAVPAVSIGSTPSMAAHDDLTGVDEVRPGNYAFYDWMQVAAGVCRPDDVAVSVLASVVSHQPGAGQVIVDAGALAMSKDLGPHGSRARGLGPLYAGLSGAALEPKVNLVAVSQEHGFVAGAGPGDVDGRFAVGELVRIMPNHSCLTAAMFDEYVVVRGGEVVDRWKILRGR
jgi:D-serine deaminase-like pyridoxal phosphate-dependent protein